MNNKKKIAIVVGFVSLCIIIMFAVMFGKVESKPLEVDGHSYNRMKIFGITGYEIVHNPDCKCIKKI